MRPSSNHHFKWRNLQEIHGFEMLSAIFCEFSTEDLTFARVWHNKNRNGQGHSLTKAQWQGQRGVLRWGVSPRFSGVASLLWIFTNLKVQNFSFKYVEPALGKLENSQISKTCVSWGDQQVALRGVTLLV